jgi:Flp pilus assembly protein CpaB
MKRRSWLWLVTSIILAVLAGVVAIVALNRMGGTETAQTQAPKQQVVVARNPIAANSVLGADNLRVEERDQIPSGAAVKVQDVLGSVAMRDFAEGEPILMQSVTSPGEVITGTTRNLDFMLGNDKIAVALQADDILSKWGAVLPGDHVDVLFTVDVILETPMTAEEMPTTEQGQAFLAIPRDQSLDNVSVLILQNLEVLQIITEPQAQPAEGQQEQAAPTIPARALILKIDPQDAVVLKYIRDSVGKVDVALRGPSNTTLFDAQPVNINYLVLRYGIVVPQPLQ